MTYRFSLFTMMFMLLLLMACGGGSEDEKGTSEQTIQVSSHETGVESSQDTQTTTGGTESVDSTAMDESSSGQGSSVVSTLSSDGSELCIPELPMPKDAIQASSLADVSFQGVETNDFSGGQVTWVGDVNGDSLDDFLIGNDGGSPVYLFFGRATWPSEPIHLSESDASWATLDGEVLSGILISAAGDVNADGFADILFQNSTADEGCRIFLWFGGVTGWQQEMDLSASPASFTTNEGSGIDWIESKWAGDINGDAIDDFLVRANQPDGSGRVYLFLGSPSNWGQGMDLHDVAVSSFTVPAGATIPQISASGVGDVNNDGFDDLLIGDPKNRATARNGGKTYVIFGQQTWPETIDPAEVTASFAGLEKSEFTGMFVARAGDVNGDGFSDFLIASAPNLVSSRFYLFLGKQEGWSTNMPFSDAVADWSSAGTFDTELSYTSIPISIASAGRVNSDTLDDFFISMLTYILCPDGNLAGKVSQVNLLLGRSSWSKSQNMSNADLILATSEDRGYAFSLFSGDGNGDDTSDLFIGSASTHERAGAAFLIFGPQP